MAETIRLDGRSLTLAQVAAVARGGARVALHPDAAVRMAASHAWVVRAAEGELRDAAGQPLPIYGVNTGYGSLARVRIEQERITALSWNLVRSHAAGVGPEVPVDQVRAMMLLRANALARGASGVRTELVERIAQMLDAGLTPVVPQRGSCGSSGDLAPLSHLALVLFRGEDGETVGRARLGDEVLPSGEAMARAGLEPLVPGPKDGLAITNGAQLTCAIAALACHDAVGLIHDAEIAAALSWEALRGVTRALHPDVHALRPFPGAIDCAADLRALLAGSGWVDSDPGKVQDAYSLRCTPQVLGAVRDAVRYAAGQVLVELNSVTDNPVILVDDPHENKAFSAGLFHGEPVGFAADHLRLALCELGSLAERRLYRLTTGTLSGTLPALLTRAGRLGMGLAQTTAAALVSENKQLAWPASADSIPTCEDQEDHVAMSTTAARRSARVLVNARRVVAIELVAAHQALLLRREEDGSLPFGAGSAAAQRALGEALAAVTDETPAAAIAAVDALLASGGLRSAVEAAVGPLREVARA